MEEKLISEVKQYEVVTNKYLHLIDGFSYTNLYNMIRYNEQYKFLQSKFADFIAEVWRRNRTAKFQESLNYFEKMGFLNKVKENNFYKNLGLEQDIIKITIIAFSDLLPWIIQSYTQKREAEKIIELIVSGLAYINQDFSQLLQGRIQYFHRNLGIRYNRDKLKKMFDKYVTDKPVFPEIPDSVMNKRFNFYITILNVSDLNDAKVRERAGAFGEFLGENSVNIEATIKNNKSNLEFFSDKSFFDKVTLLELFSDLVDDVNSLKSASDYIGGLDPFKEMREKRKRIAKNITVGSLLGGATLLTGEVGDLLIASGIPIINTIVNKDLDVDKQIEIHERMKKLKKSLAEIKEKKEKENKEKRIEDGMEGGNNE